MPSTTDTTNLPTNLALGIFLAAASAIGLGTAVAASRMAYEGGTDALTVSAARSFGVVVLTATLIQLTGRRFRLPTGRNMDVVVLGLLLGYTFYANIAAVQYIPVGMAALLLFVYPPVVALVTIACFGGRFSLIKLISIVTAFSGLGLALGVSLTGLRWEGVALSLTAGLAVGINAIWIAQRLRHLDPLALSFHLSWIATLGLWAVVALNGGPTVPTTTQGWIGAALVVGLQMSCLPMYFASIRHAGAETSSMVTNVQPPSSIIAAYVLYDEVLTSWQWLGAAMVVGGIFLMQSDDHRARRQSART